MPKIVANPLNKKNDLRLLGIIDKTPAMSTRGSRTKILNTLGHYTAIVQRTDNCWIEYNDLVSSEKEIKNIKEINPHLLMYIQSK